MSKFYKKLGIALFCISAATACSANKISFFVGYPQPIVQETYAPMVVRQVYMPREYKRCYIERSVYVNGVIYPGQRICEHRLAPTETVWAPDGGIDTYRVHRHHITYKHYE